MESSLIECQECIRSMDICIDHGGPECVAFQERLNALIQECVELLCSGISEVIECEECSDKDKIDGTRLILSEMTKKD